MKSTTLMVKLMSHIYHCGIGLNVMCLNINVELTDFYSQLLIAPSSGYATAIELPPCAYEENWCSDLYCY